jgi:hypothetical protein
MKVQVDASGVIVSDDGYLIGAGALHPTGHVYAYEHTGPIVELPIETYNHLLALGRQGQADTRERIAAGERVGEGQRHEALKVHVLQLIRSGLEPGRLLGEALAFNRDTLGPPTLDEKEVARQVRGLVGWAARHPSEEERATGMARWHLAVRRAGRAPRAPRAKTSALWLPFADVALSGPLRWVWRGKLPENAVTLLAGRPKLGKSLLTIWLAAQLSRGLLFGAHYGKPARTLLIPAEDPVDPIVKGRLVAAGADEFLVGTLASRPPTLTRGDLGGLDGLERASRSEGRIVERDSDQAHQDRQLSHGGLERGRGGLDRAGALARRITIPDEYPLLEQLIVENEIALLVLDPINSFLSSKIDSHKDAEIRRVLDPLGAMAARRRFAALAVVHLNRRTDTDVLNRILGSTGYGGSARSILTFGLDPEDETRRVVAAEGNWQRENHSEVFEIHGVTVFPNADPEERTQPALVHVGTSDLDSSDLVDRVDDDRAAFDQAKEFLLGELALGPVPVADLRRGAEANAIAWRTVERAKKRLGVEARRISNAGTARGAGRWEWFLELVEERTNEPEA